jgi:hypothetical protein
MNVTNGTDESSSTTNNNCENTDTKDTSTKTPPPAEEPGDVPLSDDVTSSSSPERRGSEDQPVVISRDMLPAVSAMLEGLGPRRVKVYELRGDEWVDLGTGFCKGFVENVLPTYPRPFTTEHGIYSSHQRRDAHH